jgi:nucleotide-binding universal stress UspA family protein
MTVLEYDTYTEWSMHAPLHSGPILVACDGAPTAHDALFNAGQCAAAAFNAAIEVLGVCAPTPGVAAGMDVLPAPMELDELRRGAMLDDVRRAVSIAAASNASWPSTVLVGAPPRLLAAEAARRNATMLVMGIGRHNPLDRLFGAETTLATLRESTVPVLAVGGQFVSAPRHAVVGLDFSAASVEAARMALRLVGPSGRLTLAHVRPRFEHPSADWQTWDAEYGRTLPPLFEQVRATIGVPKTVTFETITVRGDPAPALLAFAQQANVDLVAVGTQRHSFMERLVVGSVATRVLRTARCAVLAVPARGEGKG